MRDSPFTLKIIPCCQSVNRIIAVPTASPDAKAPGWTRIKCLWEMAPCTSASLCSGRLRLSRLSLFSLRAVHYAAFHARHTPSQSWVDVFHPCCPWNYMGDRNYLLIFLSGDWCLCNGFLNQVSNAYSPSCGMWTACHTGLSGSPSALLGSCPSQDHQLLALLIRQIKRYALQKVEE